MVLRQIYALYFSPTGGTEKIVSSIADTLSRSLELPVHLVDFTYLENRQKEYHFPNDSLVIIGTPVYAGRIPNKILPDFKKCIVGAGHTPVIPVCVYGNRNYDEALRELLLLSEENGCIPVAAAAMISQHAFSDTLAIGRPDIQDFKKLNSFSKNCFNSLNFVLVPLTVNFKVKISSIFSSTDGEFNIICSLYLSDSFAVSTTNF